MRNGDYCSLLFARRFQGANSKVRSRGQKEEDRLQSLVHRLRCNCARNDKGSETFFSYFPGFLIHSLSPVP
jgi:hypothetical protein